MLTGCEQSLRLEKNCSQWWKWILSHHNSDSVVASYICVCACVYNIYILYTWIIWLCAIVLQMRLHPNFDGSTHTHTHSCCGCGQWCSTCGSWACWSCLAFTFFDCVISRLVCEWSRCTKMSMTHSPTHPATPVGSSTYCTVLQYYSTTV